MFPKKKALIISVILRMHLNFKVYCKYMQISLGSVWYHFSYNKASHLNSKVKNIDAQPANTTI